MKRSVDIPYYAELFDLENRALAAICVGITKPKELAAQLSISIFSLRGILGSLCCKFAVNKVSELEEAVTAGKLPQIPPPPTPEEVAARSEAQSRLNLHNLRTFLRRLGSEDPERHCRNSSCARGAIEHGIFCRRHHIDMFARASGYRGDA